MTLARLRSGLQGWRGTEAWTTSRSLKRGIVGFGALMLALGWGWAASGLQESYALAVKHTESNGRNLSNAFADHVHRTVSTIDQQLLQIGMEVERSRGAFSLRDWARQQDRALALFRQVIISDRTGRPVQTSEAFARVPSRLLDPEALSRHAAANDGLLISKPFPDQASGRTWIQLSRRLNRSDGAFDGIVAAFIEPEALSTLYTSVEIGSSGLVAVVGSDGIVRARAPHTDNRIGRSIAKSPLFKQYQRADSGCLSGPASTDGVERIFCFRHVPDLPLVVSVGFSYDDVLRDYRASRTRHVAAMGGVTVLAVLLIWYLLNHERKLARANEAVRRSEGRYRDLIHDLQEVVYTADESGRWVFLSPAWERLMGMPVSESIGRSYRDWLHPEDRSPEIIKRHIQVRRETARLEMRLVRPDGREVRVEVSGRLAYDGSGNFTGTRGVIHDVSDRHEAAEALRRSEALHAEKSSMLAATLDSMNEGIIMIGQDNRVKTINRKGLDFLGLPDGVSAVGLTPQQVIRWQFERGEFGDPGDRSILERVLRECGGDGDLSRTPPIYYRTRPNGVQFEVRTIRLPDGGHTRVYTDVTARQQAVEALRASEARYAEKSAVLEATFENMDQGIMMIAPDFTVAVMNRRLKELLDLPDELFERRMSFPEIVRWQWEAGEFGPGGCMVEEGVRSHLRNADLATMPEVYTRQRPNGITLEIRTIALPTGGWVRTYTDITDHRRAEAELARAKDAAEAGNRAKSAFLATMSHEIRTPLNGVVGMAGLLIETDLSQEQRECAETIRHCSDALLAIINDVLDFSKLEAGLMAFEKAAFDPAQVARSVLGIVEPGAREKGIATGLAVAPDLPGTVLGDPGRLRQVLLNLVGNAVKFTDRGSVVVTMSGGGSGRRLRFEVQDTGIGIPPEARNRLFREFSQVEASITRRFGGTGLGLAISKKIVEAMGGAIGAESEAGGGSLFWFEIPLDEAPPLAAPRSAEPAGPPAAGAKCLKVLVVEDNRVNQRVATGILAKMGHAADLASNGLEAVARVEAEAYDLVLMDMQMPQMNGLEATRVIRAMGRPAADVPIVAMTANALASDREACLAAGMDDFISKPVDRRKLERAVARAAASAGADPSSAQAVPETSIDHWRMHELAQELGEEGMAELVASFWQDAGQIIDLFRRACDAGDLEAMGRALHTLKGAAANLGIVGCISACDRARASLREHGAVEAPALAAALLRAVSESERALLAAGTSRPRRARPSVRSA
jgi:PAS domain S-box-containing protein